MKAYRCTVRNASFAQGEPAYIILVPEVRLRVTLNGNIHSLQVDTLTKEAMRTFAARCRTIHHAVRVDLPTELVAELLTLVQSIPAIRVGLHDAHLMGKTKPA